MKARTLIAAALVASPLLAYADRVVVYETRPVYPNRMYVCSNENDRLWDRHEALDRDKQSLEMERQDLERVRRQLADELARLDRTDTAAVASYNARSQDLNARVESLNRRVADVNGAVAFLNADSRDLVAYCDRVNVARR